MFTEKYNTKAGVRQGDPLSSTLFSVYINDLIDFPSFINEGKLTDINTDVIGVNCLLFADDIVLIGSSETELQFLLDRANTRSKSCITLHLLGLNVVSHHRSKKNSN